MIQQAILLVLTVLLAAPSIAYSQDDPCKCNKVLIDGVYNYRSSKGDVESIEVLKSYIVRTGYEEYSKSGDHSLGFSYAGIGLDGASSKNKYQQKQDEFRAEGYTGREFKESSAIIEKYGDPLVLKAWSDCMAGCNFNGGISHAIQVDDETNGSVIITYRPGPGVIGPIVTGSSIQNATVSGGSLEPGKALKDDKEIPVGQTILSFKRSDTSLPVVINVGLSGGRDIRAFVPKYIEPMSGELPCEAIRNISLVNGEFNVACNENTEDGYYWEVDISNRLRPYGEYMLGGNDICDCNSNEVGRNAETFSWKENARYYVYWYPVRTHYWRLQEGGILVEGSEGPVNSTLPDHDRNVFVGVYKATCKKY